MKDIFPEALTPGRWGRFMPAEAGRRWEPVSSKPRRDSYVGPLKAPKASGRRAAQWMNPRTSNTSDQDPAPAPAPAHNFRMLQNSELARAMGFDDEETTYEFVGNVGEVTRQIGNAVPVNLAEALVRAMLEEG